jgi:hypothetical protein
MLWCVCLCAALLTPPVPRQQVCLLFQSLSGQHLERRTIPLTAEHRVTVVHIQYEDTLGTGCVPTSQESHVVAVEGHDHHRLSAGRHHLLRHRLDRVGRCNQQDQWRAYREHHAIPCMHHRQPRSQGEIEMLRAWPKRLGVGEDKYSNSAFARSRCNSVFFSWDAAISYISLTSLTS